MTTPCPTCGQPMPEQPRRDPPLPMLEQPNVVPTGAMIEIGSLVPSTQVEIVNRA